MSVRKGIKNASNIHYYTIAGIVLVIVGARRKGPHGSRIGAGTVMLVTGIVLIIFFLFGFIALMLGIG